MIEQQIEINRKLFLKNGAPYTSCISKINYTLIDNTEDLDIVMSVYNLIEYRKKFLNSTLTGITPNHNKKEVEIAASLKYSSNFWRTLQMPLFNCIVNLNLT